MALFLQRPSDRAFLPCVRLLLLPVVWALLVVSSAFAEETSGPIPNFTKPFIYRADIPCPNGEQVHVFSFCRNDLILDCYLQHIVIKQKKGVYEAVSGHHSPTYGINNNNELQFFGIDGVATRGACLEGRGKQNYLIMSYINGGNCASCEWDEIYDMKGYLLTPRARSKRAASDRIYKRLGLPEKDSLSPGTRLYPYPEDWKKQP